MVRSTGQPVNLAVMLSGSGRTLANLLACIALGELNARVVLVIGSRECKGLDIAREAEIPIVIERGRIGHERLESLLRAHDAAYVALAGYLNLVDIPPAFEGRIVNIHPALLPSFGGAGMYGHRVHEAVLASGATESGCTVHVCNAVYDDGQVLVQRKCPVLPGDSPESLAARVFTLECEAYPEALRRLFAMRADPKAGSGGTGQ